MCILIGFKHPIIAPSTKGSDIFGCERPRNPGKNRGEPVGIDKKPRAGARGREIRQERPDGPGQLRIWYRAAPKTGKAQAAPPSPVRASRITARLRSISGISTHFPSTSRSTKPSRTGICTEESSQDLTMGSRVVV